MRFDINKAPLNQKEIDALKALEVKAIKFNKRIRSTLFTLILISLIYILGLKGGVLPNNSFFLFLASHHHIGLLVSMITLTFSPIAYVMLGPSMEEFKLSRYHPAHAAAHRSIKEYLEYPAVKRYIEGVNIQDRHLILHEIHAIQKYANELKSEKAIAKASTEDAKLMQKIYQGNSAIN